ncbi:MAG: hypothetical protein K8S56_00595, partial [Candidatus Cloacimonetes bacterium]|nr:hypothetical protein [Candidatus Cloacimonadota bacterium]
PKIIHLTFSEGDIEITAGECFRLVWEAYGHGFPGRKLNYRQTASNDSFAYSYSHEGYFTELKVTTKIEIPFYLTHQTYLDIGTGNGNLLLPDSVANYRVIINSEPPDTLSIGETSPSFLEINTLPGKLKKTKTD